MVDSTKTVFTFQSLSGKLEQIAFTGSVKVDASGEDNRVSVAVNAPRLNLRPFLVPGLQIPEKIRQAESVGRLEVSLGLTDPAGPIGSAELQLKVGSADRLAVSLQGSIKDAAALKGIDLELEAGGREAAELGRLFGASLGLRGPYGLKTSIRDPDAGIFRFDPLIISLADSRITGTAELDRSGKPLQVNAELAADEVDLTTLLPAAHDPGEPDAGRIEKAIDRQLVLPRWPIPPELLQNLGADLGIRADRVKFADLQIDDLQIKGELKAAGLRVNAGARTVYYGNGSSKISENLQIGSVSLFIQGRASEDRMAIDSFQLRGGSPDTIMVSLEGSAVDSIRQTGIKFQFDIQGRDARRVWQMLDADFRASGPFSLSGRLVDARLKQYRFDNLKAQVGKSSIEGWLGIDYTGRRPRISARFFAPYLDLRPYLPEAGESSVPEPPAKKPSRDRRLFSDQPWPLDVLEKIDQMGRISRH